MKITLFLIIVCLLLVFNASYSQTTKEHVKRPNSGIKDASFINGAWRREDNKEFDIMHEGYFNFLGQDSTGNWNNVHAGSYVINKDHPISLKVLYSSDAEHIDAVNTAEYQISGRTLKIKNFKKLIKHGVDVTHEVPKQEWMTMVRATEQ